MSLVDVRSSSLVDMSGPGPGSGLGAGAGLGRGGRVSSSLGSPLGSPLDSPLDSPLGSPLGAVSLDAAVFVAKGGLNAMSAMLDESSDRADSFADDFLQTGSQLMELWGLSDSCASSSSLSTATSPHLGLGLGLDSLQVAEQASVTPLFAESPDDLIDVADALNALSAGDDDAVGSSQDSTQLSAGSSSSSSSSSCCSGTSGCSGTTNFSGSTTSGAAATCCNASRQQQLQQRPRAVSPSRLGPQQCQVCSKVFSNASALAKHKLTHSDERRYACSVCCKAFKRQDHLNGHMLTHRNKKPYECVLEGCSKSYCDARSLRRHEENHHHLKGLPALKDKGAEKEKEKEVRRRNSKTILSLLSAAGESGDSEEGSCPPAPVPAPAAVPGASATATLSPKRSPAASTTVSSGRAGAADCAPDPTSPKVSTAAVSQVSGLAVAVGEASPQQQLAKAGGSAGGSVSPLVIPTVPAPTPALCVSSSQASPQSSPLPSPAPAPALISPVTVTCSVPAPAPSPGVPAVLVATQPSPLRIPQLSNPSPITIPSVRPQLLTARVVSSKPLAANQLQSAQAAPQQTTQFSLLLDQSIPQSPVQQAALTSSPQAQGDVLPANFVSSFLTSSPQQQMAQGLSQPILIKTSTSMAVGIQSPAAAVQSGVVGGRPRPQPPAEPAAQAAQAEQAVKMLPPVSWSHMTVTSTSGQTMQISTPIVGHSATHIKTNLPQTSALLVAAGGTGTVQDAALEAFQSQLHTVQQVHLVPMQSQVSLATPHTVKGTMVTEVIQKSAQQVPAAADQQSDVFKNGVDGKDFVGALKQPVRTFPLHQKKQQSKSGLAHEMPAASTSNCAPVSTLTTTTTVTTTASTLALTLTSTKSSSSPVVITSKGSTKTSTNTTCSSGISSCKVSSTAHLGSVRDAQNNISVQTSRAQTLGTQEDAKKNAKAAADAANNQSKPVACNLCNRRFKNIPALNGHMRLHGGYFKKESESKRSDKRESTGPPLQTASVSVRQLIEEKIIQKRGGTIGRVALLAGRDSAVSSTSSLMALTSTATTTTTTASCPPSSLLAQGERRRQAEQHEQAFRKLSMSSDSVSTATVLQHHNYANSSFPTPPPSVNASNTNSPPPAPPSPLTSFLPLSPQSDGSEPHQLLIHSEDPLLSSTIKDITRKKIDLGSLTVLGSVLVERGGELHLIQAPTAIVQKLSGRNTKPKHSVDTVQSFTTTESQAAITGALNAPSYQMMPQYFKSEDIEDEVFLSPPIVPDSPPSLNSPARGPCPTAKSLGAAPVSGQPLCSPRAKRPRLARPYPAYKSRLRSCRREAICSASMPFTPAPMLDPNRTGPGLMAHAGSSWHCSSTTADGEDSCDAMAISAPESDSFPHVNVGARFQCAIPSCDKRPYSWSDEPSSGQNYLLWEPGVVEKCTDAEVDAYLDFACCDAIPWGGRNQEYALHLLHMCDGDIQEAMVQLMQRSPILPADHSLLSYDYGVTELWSVEEMDTFVKALSKHMKNWTQVAKEVGNKTARECVQFYYLWKRLCPDEYNFIRSAWKEKEMMADDMNNNVQEDSNSKKSNLPWHKQNLNSSSILPLDTKLTNLDDFQNVAISLGEGSCMKGNTQSGTSVRSMSSSVSSSNNPIQFGKITYNANENGSTGNTSIVQVDATPTTNTSPSSDTTQTAVEPKISSKQHSVEVAKDLEDQMALISNNFDDERAGEIKRKVPSNVKTEPWEYCIKKEVKEELESIATDFSETKVYISEFDVVKLNHISNSTKDDDETVEEAPIIVNRSTHLNDDADDQVKMEIESMMALHGIRMEDDVSTEAINSETGTGDTQTIFKEEPQDCDLVKDTSSSSPTALTEEHVSTSSESRLFVCELADCSASFNSRAALNGHIRIHGYRKSPPPNMNAASHRLQRQEYHCETCGKTFAKLKSRNAHMKTHKLSSADLAETLAGRATGISSSGDLPSNPRSSSSGLSFSTCLNFGLPQSECKAANKEFTSEDETEGQEEMSLEKITCSPQQESSSSKDNCSSKSSSETNKKRTGSKKIPGARPISDCSRSISASSIFRSNNVLAGKPILTVSCTSSVPITNPVNDNVQQLSSHSDKKSSPSSTVKLPETSSTAADELSCKPLSIHQHKVSNKPVTSEPQKAFLKKLKAKSKQSPSAFCSLGRVK